MRDYQYGCCAICGKGGKLSIDHNHVSGEIRGLICPRCNTGLGVFWDSSVLLEKAAEYLKNPPARVRRPSPPPEGLEFLYETAPAQADGPF